MSEGTAQRESQSARNTYYHIAIFHQSRVISVRKAYRLHDKLEKLNVIVGLYDAKSIDPEKLVKKYNTIVLLYDNCCCDYEDDGAVFLGKGSFEPEFLQKCSALFEAAENRDKQIIVIAELRSVCPEFPKDIPVYDAEDGTFDCPHAYPKLVGQIYALLNTEKNKERLYEKIAELKKTEYRYGLAQAVCELCALLYSELESEQSPQKRAGLYDELRSCFTELSRHIGAYFDGEAIQTAHQIIATLKPLSGVLEHPDFSVEPADVEALTEPGEQMLRFHNWECGVSLIDLSHITRTECADTFTNGDVRSIPLQEPFLTMREQFKEALRKYRNPAMHGLTELPQTALPSAQQRSAEEIRRLKTEGAQEQPLSDEAQKLRSIADFMKQGNKLFESIGADKNAVEFLRCLKTSYERLKNYCEIIGAWQIYTECVDSLALLNQQLETMEEAETEPDTAETGFKALLGLRSAVKGEFDVFLSYKHQDEDIVKQVYRFLKSRMLQVFYDRQTLPDLSESDYAEAIFNAIDHSRHFVVVLSDLEYLQSHWVKEEMRMFHHEMSEGRKPDANFIMLVTNSVYDEIIRTNKACLPITYRSCEIMRISEYRDRIEKYLTK